MGPIPIFPLVAPEVKRCWMKDSELEVIRTAGLPLDTAAPGEELRAVVDGIKEKVGLINKPAVGRQFTKLQSCLAGLENGLWAKMNEVKGVEHWDECLGMLDALWMIYSREGWPGGLQRELRKCFQMHRILRVFEDMKRFQDGLEKAWEAYDAMLGLVGAERGENGCVLVRPEEDAAEILRTENTACLVLSLVMKLVHFLGETGNAFEVVALRTSVDALDAWIDLVESEKAKSYYARFLLCIRNCVSKGSASELAEEEMVKLIMMHVARGVKLQKLQGTYNVLSIIKAIPNDQLGTVGGAVCQSMIRTYGYTNLCNDVMESFSWEIVNTVKQSKTSSIADDFLSGFSYRINSKRPVRSRFHLCAIGALCFDCQSVLKLDKVLCLEELDMQFNNETQDRKLEGSWSYLVDGLQCLRVAGQFLANNRQKDLENYSGVGQHLLQLMVKALKLPLVFFDKPQSFKMLDAMEQKLSGLLRGTILSYWISSLMGLKQNDSMCSLAGFHRILELLIQSEYSVTDVLSLAWMLIVLARSLYTNGYHIYAVHAYLGACYFYLKTPPKEDVLSIPVQNLQHCCWRIKEVLIKSNSQDLDAEIASFRDVVVRIVINGWGNHSVHTSLIGYCVSMISGLLYVPGGCIIEQSLQMSNWREHSRRFCNLAWMEIVALNPHGPGAYMSIMDSLLSLSERLGTDNSKECIAFMGRIQILYGITAALTGKVSESQAKITCGVASLTAVADEFDGASKAHVLESAVCGYLVFSLICAAEASRCTSDCIPENGTLEQPPRFWWNQSAANLATGLENLSALNIDFEQCHLFDAILFVDLISWVSGLAGAWGLVDSEAQLRVVLEKMEMVGILSKMPPKHGPEPSLLGDHQWIGNCHSYNLKRPNCGDSDCESTSFSSIVLQIQSNMEDCGDHSLQNWLSAFFKAEPNLEKHRDKAGFHAQICARMFAARALFGQGNVQQALSCAEKARGLSIGLHNREFPEFGFPATRHTFMGDLWYVKKQAISAALLQSEIQEALGMPKEALWTLEQARKFALPIEAHSFLAIASLQHASILLQKDLLDEAWDDLHEAQKSIKSFMQNAKQEKVLLKYLEAWSSQVEGDLVKEDPSPSSWRRAAELFQQGKQWLEGMNPVGCITWPVNALRLKIESSLALCHQNQESAQQAQKACAEGLLQVFNAENVLDYLNTDALSAIYQSSKLCRKAVSSDRHDAGNSGVFFGVRSSCRKSLTDFFQDVSLTSDPSLQKDPDAMDYQESNNIDKKPDVFKWAIQTLLQSTLGSPLYIQVLLLCWNGFQELPKKLRNVSADLCAALAEGGKLHAALYFLFASMSPGFRLQGLACINASKPDAGEIKNLLAYSNFAIQPGAFDIETLEKDCKNRIEAVMCSISRGTCALGISYHPWNKNILIGRLNPGRVPILVMLPVVYKSTNSDQNRQRYDLHTALERCKEILKEQEDSFDGESNLSIKPDVLREWWSNRMQLDKSLCSLIEDVNAKCLKSWSWLLGGEVNDAQIQELLVEASCQFVNTVARSPPGTTEALVLTELVRLVYMSANIISSDEVMNAMQMLCKISGGTIGDTLHPEITAGMQRIWGICWNDILNPEQDDHIPDTEVEPRTAVRRKTRISMMQAVRTPLSSALGTCPAVLPDFSTKSEKPIALPPDIISNCGALLILDPTIQSFPWENCAGIQHYTYYRMPNLSVACMLALNHRQKSGSDLESSLIKADLESTYYVVNAYGDLPNLKEIGIQLSKVPKWDGVVDALPHWKEVSSALENRDMYIYLGHGSGEKFIDSQELKKTKCRSACFIMGCNSGKLWDCGSYEPYGSILNFLLAGCPAVIANLWLVADKDINRFTQSVLDSWQCHSAAEETMDMAHAIRPGRISCVMRCLVGAAPVCYGVPLEVKKLRSVERRKDPPDVVDLTMEGN